MLEVSEVLAAVSRRIPLPNCREWCSSLSRGTLKADLAAGLTGAVIVLPQAVAFALIAGLPPQYGLYTAIVPTIVAALFGSSHHLISGPTTAISIVLFSNVSTLAEPFTQGYVELALALTFLAGLFQLILGLARLGGLINFVSQSVMTGFTIGAALLIALGQMSHLTGLDLPRHSLIHFAAALWRGFPGANPTALTVGLCAMAVAVYMRRRHPRQPGLLLAMAVSAGLAWLMEGGKQTGGLIYVGALPSSLPPLSWPLEHLSQFGGLAPGALAVAMLGLAEAVAIARAVGNTTGQRLDNSREFVGQGLSNLVGSFFSSYASSGSFTRTGVNLQAGAKTPLAAVFSAASVTGILLLVAPFTAYLPMASVAGVLLVVAANLIHVRDVERILRTSRAEALVMAITALGSLLVNLEFALFSGVMLSLLIYLNRTAHPHFITLAPDPSTPRRAMANAARKNLVECPQLKILRLDGSIFFGAASNISEELHQILADNPNQRHVLLVGSGVNFIDVTGCQLLFREESALTREGRRLYLCSFKQAVVDTLRRGGCMEGLGRGSIFSSKPEALRSILANLDYGVCCRCQARVFRECQKLQDGYCALD